MADKSASSTDLSSDLSARNAKPEPNDKQPFADYSFSSPLMRQALKQETSGRLEGKGSAIIVDVQNLSHAPLPNKEKNNGKKSEPLGGTEESLHDLNTTTDPCHKKLTIQMAVADMPKAMDRVQDKDPALYAQIKDKVKDPRYIGEIGDITVATHDKKDKTNGCIFIQNTPYWESGPTAKSLLDANVGLVSKEKKISLDTLNSAGRTLSQEEAIAWRNTGIHAKPGKSNHGFGRAIDLEFRPDGEVQPSDDKDIREALHAHGFRQGDSHGPIKNDLHHWSWAGPGRATEVHDSPPKHRRRHQK